MISFIFDLQYKMDVEWKNLVKILVFHEEQFNEKIVPKNKLTPEMIADLRRQIQRLKVHFVVRRRTQASILMIAKKLKRLCTDLFEAAILSDMNNIIVLSSSLSLNWILSKKQENKFFKNRMFSWGEKR